MPPREPTRSRAGERRPRLTNRGKLLSNAEIGKGINNWIQDQFEEELRLTAFLDFNTRRQVRLATGIGDMDTFVSEFNNGFANSSQLSSDGKVKAKSGEQAFGESWSDRPRLKKISQEFRVTYKPKSSK